MCGISGIWNFNRTQLSEIHLERFNNSLSHRGPDGSGVKFFPEQNLGIAHRRLSILDTSEAGAQPMGDASSKLWLTFNGEVFNFIEIREELKLKGHSFHSDTDTEVILAAYLEWGESCFSKFNGMWAIAIYDTQSEELMLCRDRFGIKPLYYLDSPERFAFASETNAFKELEAFTREIVLQKMQIGIDDTYALEGIGHTLFKDIYQLLPGHLIKLKMGQRPQQRRWYDIREHVVNIKSSYESQVTDYRELLEDCVALRMRSDVSLATALSGGVDSTAVYSVVHQLMSGQRAERVPENWQQAFVQTFPGTDIDEREWAEKAIAHTGGKATYLVPEMNDLSAQVVDTTRRFDAISSTPILALMGVYRGMRQAGVTVSLDGHGVDEMLFGYKTLVHAAYQYQCWHGTQFEAEEISDVLVGLFPIDQRASRTVKYREEIQGIFKNRNSLVGKLKSTYRKLSPKEPKSESLSSLKELSDKPYDFSLYSDLDRPVLIDFFQRTLPSLLRNFDKASMMSGIEIRMPFMDHRMVSRSFSLPISAKLGGGYTKRILRDAMKGIMPEANRVRTYKVGLGAPTGRWLEGELSDLVQDTLHSKNFIESNVFDGKAALKIHSSLKNASDPDNIHLWKYLNAHWISE